MSNNAKKYGMNIARWHIKDGIKDVLTIEADSLSELTNLFHTMNSYNDLSLYEPLDFISVYEIE